MVTLGVFKLEVGVDAGEVEDVEASPGLWEASEPTLATLAFSFFSASLVETNTLFFARGPFLGQRLIVGLGLAPYHVGQMLPARET